MFELRRDDRIAYAVIV